MKMQFGANGLPVLEQFREEGFVDCVLEIQNLRKDLRYICFHMAASFGGQVVGLDVRVLSGIQSGFDQNMELDRDHVYRSDVTFTRSGPESDRLLAAIAQLYQSGITEVRMIDVETYTAIALHQGDTDMELEPIKIKIFGNDNEADSAEEYYESFFNLDIPNGLVFWNEKDQDYRVPLVKSLSANLIH